MITTTSVGLLLASAVLTVAAHAEVVFVDGALTTGANDGTSWDNAFQGSSGLHAALAAVAPGDEVWITAGTYLPSDVADPAVSFSVATDSVTVRGGFEGIEDSPLQRRGGVSFETVLSGDLLGNDAGSAASRADNSAVVVLVSENHVTLEGLTVTAGGNAPEGANLVASAPPNPPNPLAPRLTLTRCRFDEGLGTGVRISAPGALEISDCVFETNAGAGLEVDSSGAAGQVISRSTFARNGGHGLHLTGGDSLTVALSNLLLVENGGHGAVRSFVGVVGGLVGTLQAFDQCTIAHNTGAGISMEGCTACVVTMVRLRSSIVWGNDQGGAQVIFPGSGGEDLDLIDSILQGSAGAAGLDPLFVDPLAGDFSLTSASPAVDQALASGPFDARGQHRTFDVPGIGANGSAATSDLGALEFTASIGSHLGCAEATPNSTGHAGRVFARGTAVVASNQLTLRGDRLPPGQFAIALASRRFGEFFQLNGDGTLCLGPPIGRFVAPGQVRQISLAGTFTLPVGLTRIPTPSAFVAVQPGETWRFQLWHRDVPGPSQFSGVVSVRFE